MAATLLDLPPELLTAIVDLVVVDSDPGTTATDSIINLRRTCKALHDPCHVHFLRCLTCFDVDLTNRSGMTKLLAVSKSPVHAAAIKEILFLYTEPDLVWIMPRLRKAFTNLGSLKDHITIVIDPFAQPKTNKRVTKHDSWCLVNNVLVAAALSKLTVDEIHVRARRDSLTDIAVPVDSPEIKYGDLLWYMHTRLVDEQHKGFKDFDGWGIPVLVADFQSAGSMSYHYAQASLKVNGLSHDHWIQLKPWSRTLVPQKIEIQGGEFMTFELQHFFFHTRANSLGTHSLTIINSKPIHEWPPEEHETTRMETLLRVFVRWGLELEHCRLESIWDASTDAEAPSFSGEERVIMEGKEHIQAALPQLRARFLQKQEG
ncbi:hypothetical protein D6C97_07002 [Aureobasidium pullulans]|nr:hypothetical protein D6C97_07002 [Aureobasidium pullulans]